MLWVSQQANNKFVLKIVEARGVGGNLSRLFGIGVKAGTSFWSWCSAAAIYHGEELVCRPETTRYITPVENPQW